MGKQPDIFEDLRRVGALKRDRLGAQPADNALSKVPNPKLSRDTIGAWLRGERFPTRLSALLDIVKQIRAEAVRAGVLADRLDGVAGETVADLLAEDRWRKAWETEHGRRIQADREAVERQKAQAALEHEERRARRAALADRPRPVRSWSPQRLGVHRAIPGYSRDRSDGFVLPWYVPRRHDAELRTHLAAAVANEAAPTLVVVRGESCTGKTRTAFEAVRAVVPDEFELLFPADADGLLAVLAADALDTRTVLWLNEAQNYLDDPAGEAVAAALLRRLDDDGPLIVIATLWPAHEEALTAAPAQDGKDPHWHARTLLGQARRIGVPRSFADGLDAANNEAHHDHSLAAALEAGGADMTQTLAAGPDLVRHYEDPAGPHGCYGKALVEVAMDAYRLGVTGPLPLSFLEAAAPGYLTDSERRNAGVDWFAHALAYAQTLVKHTTSSLQDVPRPSGMGSLSGVVRLADYLQQHGRRTRQALYPPTSFWDAVLEHLSNTDELRHLAHAACQRSRHSTAAALYCAAANAGNTYALLDLASMREKSGDREAAERLAHQAADAGNPRALEVLARMRWESGDREAAERLARQAADAGNPRALRMLGGMLEEIGQWQGAARLYRAAADAGNIDALMDLAWMHNSVGDSTGAEALYRSAADAGNSQGLLELALMRQESGDREAAERLARQAADAGNPQALRMLARMREEIGDWAGVIRLLGGAYGLGALAATMAEMRARSGDLEEAKVLYGAAVDAGNLQALRDLVKVREECGDREGAERLVHQAAEASHTEAMWDLVNMREKSGDREGIEPLLRAAVDAGNTDALLRLARMRAESGDRGEAEALYRAAVDAGIQGALEELVRIQPPRTDACGRYGLEPDGTWAKPWLWPEPRNTPSDPS
ncbi:tetratricopeptide repeat protein [Streptomyces noursei]|uniref:tetratricopeptide repeat protein n=1 Tax=Streptomyces noursei TaxID=1971 RepID=UPI0030F34904